MPNNQIIVALPTDGIEVLKAMGRVYTTQKTKITTLEAQVSDLQVQLANTPQPIVDVELNTLINDVRDEVVGL